MAENVTGQSSKMSENSQYVLEVVKESVNPLLQKLEGYDGVKSSVLVLAGQVEKIQKSLSSEVEQEQFNAAMLTAKLDDVSDELKTLISAVEELSDKCSKVLLATTNMAARVDAEAEPDVPYTADFLEDLE